MASSRDRFRNELLAKLQDTPSLALRWHRHDYCVGAEAARPGTIYNFVVLQRMVRIELETDAGDPRGLQYKTLLRHRESIEISFGGPLVWDFKADRASYQRISVNYPDIGYGDDSNWAGGMGKLIKVMVRFVGALTPYLERMR